MSVLNTKIKRWIVSLGMIFTFHNMLIEASSEVTNYYTCFDKTCEGLKFNKGKKYRANSEGQCQYCYEYRRLEVKLPVTKLYNMPQEHSSILSYALDTNATSGKTHLVKWLDLTLNLEYGLFVSFDDLRKEKNKTDTVHKISNSNQNDTTENKSQIIIDHIWKIMQIKENQPQVQKCLEKYCDELVKFSLLDENYNFLAKALKLCYIANISQKTHFDSLVNAVNVGKEYKHFKGLKILLKAGFDINKIYCGEPTSTLLLDVVGKVISEKKKKANKKLFKICEKLIKSPLLFSINLAPEGRNTALGEIISKTLGENVLCNKKALYIKSMLDLALLTMDHGACCCMPIIRDDKELKPQTDNISIRDYILQQEDTFFKHIHDESAVKRMHALKKKCEDHPNKPELSVEELKQTELIQNYDVPEDLIKIIPLYVGCRFLILK